MELLPAIVGLAVVDSVNPSALLATIVLLLRGRAARPLVAVYVAAVLVTYFAIGLVLALGLGLTRQAVIESDAAYLIQGVLGAAMLAYAVLAPGQGRRRDPVASRKLPAVRRPAAVFALGDRATALLERLRARLGGAAREGLLWLLGLAGFFLLTDALGHFGIIG